MNGHKYRLKYDLKTEAGEFTRDEIARSGDKGATDALVVISCLYPADGSYSQSFFCLDGRQPPGGSMPAGDVWKAWVMLAGALSRDEFLSPNKRELCQLVLDAVAGVAMKAKAEMEAGAADDPPETGG